MQALKTEPARLFAISTGLVLAAAVAGVLAASLTATPAHAAGSEDFSAGLQVKASAKVADVGLPVFPGAVPKASEGDDHHGATVGAHWGSLFGFKVAVLKYTSTEPITTVAGYYREALAQHGPVLDCSHGVPRAAKPKDDAQLRCNDDQPRPGELVYKVGTQGSQRVVSLRPAAGGVDFQLVRIEVRGG